MYWIDKRWASISGLISSLTSSLLSKKFETPDITKELDLLLTREGKVISSALVLSKVVEVARAFGFSGVSVFIDKIDEHPKTQNSPEASARLVHPILSQVRLLEIEGLGFQFFIWDRVKSVFLTGEQSVRLDKIASSEVLWNDEFLIEMVRERLNYFSDGKQKSFSDLCELNVDADDYLRQAILLTARSPRESIRLLDILTREYDVRYASSLEVRLLRAEDFELAMDKYVQDVIWNVYDRTILSQILRLDLVRFINKDVQGSRGDLCRIVR